MTLLEASSAYMATDLRRLINESSSRWSDSAASLCIQKHQRHSAVQTVEGELLSCGRQSPAAVLGPVSWRRSVSWFSSQVLRIKSSTDLEILLWSSNHIVHNYKSPEQDFCVDS